MSGTNTASRNAETAPEPLEERATAEQPRPSTAIEKRRHSSFDEQNLPKPKRERKRKPKGVEVGSGETDSGETDSGETDSHCGGGARATCGQAKVGVYGGCKKERARTHTEDCLPGAAPFTLPFSSSSSSSSALTFVSASSSRSYLLKTFVDLTSPLRSVLLREVETVQSASPYAMNGGTGSGSGSVDARRRMMQGARRRGGLLTLRKLLGRDGPVGVALRNEKEGRVRVGP